MLIWIMKAVSFSYIDELNRMCSVFFRSISSLLFALFISLVASFYIIKWFQSIYIFQIIRTNGPKEHVFKKETPTMGGIAILMSIVISIAIWSDLSNLYVWYILFILMTYGLLGFVDDFLKIRRKSTVGLRALTKYVWQSVIALVLVLFVFISRFCDMNVQFKLEMFKNIIFQLDIWSIMLAYFVIVGTSNAVNLSDGLDGLAIIPVILIAVGLSVVSWGTSDLYISKYLHISYIDHAKELVVICAIIIGSSLGFLWFNSYPAQIFMGDVGSLSIGGAIGTISVLLYQEYLLLIMGGIFVIESLSVIFQVIYFKIFKKRIFKMAPIHHHFELLGYTEPKIVIRFWIVSSILVLFGLAVLKLK